MVHIADPGEHIVDEALMPRHIDEAKKLAVRQPQIRKADIDGEAARLLLRQPVGIDAGQRAHQRGLAVVHMSGRRDDHGGLWVWAEGRIRALIADRRGPKGNRSS